MWFCCAEPSEKSESQLSENKVIQHHYLPNCFSAQCLITALRASFSVCHCLWPLPSPSSFSHPLYHPSLWWKLIYVPIWVPPTQIRRKTSPRNQSSSQTCIHNGPWSISIENVIKASLGEERSHMCNEHGHQAPSRSRCRALSPPSSVISLHNDIEQRRGTMFKSSALGNRVLFEILSRGCKASTESGAKLWCLGAKCELGPWILTRC